MATDSMVETRRENFEKRNVRFLGYHLLRNVQYNGEPVVPVIISEGDDEEGMHFNVEKLGGIDLDKFLDLPADQVPVRLKLQVMDHVVAQLQAIDEAGFWIYDRAGRNIRVLSWGGEISTRQVDVDDIYDLKHSALYTNRREAYLEPYAVAQEHLGQSPWINEISELSFLLFLSLPEHYRRGFDFKKYGGFKTFEVAKNKFAVNPLAEFRKDLSILMSKS